MNIIVGALITSIIINLLLIAAIILTERQEAKVKMLEERNANQARTIEGFVDKLSTLEHKNTELRDVIIDAITRDDQEDTHA